VIALNIKKEEAFTLIEVMLSIVLITLILGVLFNLNLSGWKFWKLNQDNVELSQVTTLISTNLDRKIRSQDIDHIKIVDNNLELDNGDYIVKVENNDLIIDDNGNERIIVNDLVSNLVNDDYFSFVYIEADGTIDSFENSVELNNEINGYTEEEKDDFKKNLVIEYKITLEKNNKTLVVEKRVKPRL